MNKKLINSGPEKLFSPTIAFLICVPIALVIASCGGSAAAGGGRGILPIVLILLALLFICIPFALLFNAYMGLYSECAQDAANRSQEEQKQSIHKTIEGPKERKDNNGIEPG